jgi:hypothetical protein
VFYFHICFILLLHDPVFLANFTVEIGSFAQVSPNFHYVHSTTMKFVQFHSNKHKFNLCNYKSLLVDNTGMIFSKFIQRLRILFNQSRSICHGFPKTSNSTNFGSEIARTDIKIKNISSLGQISQIPTTLTIEIGDFYQFHSITFDFRPRHALT